MNYYLEVLKKYAVFTGRATRAEYWYFFLFNILASIAIGIVVAVIKSASNDVLNLSLLGNLYSLAVLCPGLAVGIRRLHDTNRSGWWILIGLIPLIGTIILIVFLATDSQPGSNQYGPNPKGAKGATPTPTAAN
ncbi:MAG: DUF805 domain-containing protein [Patescibacteria group bacterium]